MHLLKNKKNADVTDQHITFTRVMPKLVLIVSVLFSSACGPPPSTLSPPPTTLKLDPFFRKYVDADGIPVVSNNSVDDAALLESKRLLEAAVPAELHGRFVSAGLRVELFDEAEGLKSLPEHQEDWASYGDLCGLTETTTFRVSVNAQAMLCRSQSCNVGSTFLHETGHATRAAVSTELSDSIERAYTQAIAAGLWAKSYGRRNSDEYWAEGSQIWFDAKPAALGDGINTRAKLKAYDETLAGLLTMMFGDDEWRYECPQGLPTDS